MTLQEILDEIVHKLDWRGPSGKSMAHIVLSREEACMLVHDIGKLQLTLQQLEQLIIDEEETSS